MIFGQLTRALSLNDICDTLRHHSGVLLTLRRATPPSRNGLSHANKVRNSAMAKDLFYETLHHFSGHFPRFGRFDKTFKIPRKLKRTINLVDSTTIVWIGQSIDEEKQQQNVICFSMHRLFCLVLLW
jgi:hypothetical protein